MINKTETRKLASSAAMHIRQIQILQNESITLMSELEGETRESHRQFWAESDFLHKLDANKAQIGQEQGIVEGLRIAARLLNAEDAVEALIIEELEK